MKLSEGWDKMITGMGRETYDPMENPKHIKLCLAFPFPDASAVVKLKRDFFLTSMDLEQNSTHV